MGILERDWHALPGASDEAIRRLAEAVPITLPNSYLSLLRLTNGGEGPLARQPYNLCLDAAEDVADTATSRRYEEFFPSFIIIGSNGGGEFIALDARNPDVLPVVALDMTNSDLRDTVMHIASDFDAFVDLIGVEASD
jgi:hypothetical protein